MSFGRDINCQLSLVFLDSELAFLSQSLVVDQKGRDKSNK